MTLSQFRVIPGAVAPAGAPTVDLANARAVIPARGAAKSFIDALSGSYSDFEKAFIKNAYYTAYGQLAGALDVFTTKLKTAADSVENFLGGAAETENHSASFSNADGFTLNGTSSWIGSDFNPSTFSVPKYSLNSAHFAFYLIDPLAFNGYLAGNVSGGLDNFRLGPRQAAGNVAVRLNSTTTLQTARSFAAYKGTWLLNRPSASAVRLLFNGALVQEWTDTATGIPNVEMALGRSQGNYAAGKVGGMSIGRGLTPAEEQALSSLMKITNEAFLA